MSDPQGGPQEYPNMADAHEFGLWVEEEKDTRTDRVRAMLSIEPTEWENEMHLTTELTSILNAVGRTQPWVWTPGGQTTSP